MCGKKLGIFVICMTWLFSGCSSVPVTEIKTETTVVKPTTDLIKDCDITAVLPDKQTYLNQNPSDKETSLHDYAATLQKDMRECNLRWAVLRNWFSKQEKIFSNK